MSSVTGYVFEGIDGKMHFSLDVADQKLIAKLRRYLTDAASFAMNHSDYEQAEAYLHDANHLYSLMSEAVREGEKKAEAEAEAEEKAEAEAEEGSEVEE
nr:MAG TPA: hypothetical protein [Caudoviricetes sp.]